MTINKNIHSFLLTILLAVSVSGLQSGGNQKKEQKSRYKQAVDFLRNHKAAAIAVPIVAVVAYSIVQGDIPFIDIPQEYLEYFDLTAWSNYFTASTEIILDSGSGADAPTTLIMSQAAEVKSLLEALPKKELKAIIDAIPESMIARVPEASSIAEKVVQDLNSVSDVEISSLIESINACIVSMKANGETLSVSESIAFIKLYWKYFDLIEQLKAILGF